VEQVEDGYAVAGSNAGGVCTLTGIDRPRPALSTPIVVTPRRGALTTTAVTTTTSSVTVAAALEPEDAGRLGTPGIGRP
jgi:hypothetical protein